MSRILVFLIVGSMLASCTSREEISSTCTDGTMPQYSCQEAQNKGFFAPGIVNHVPTRQERTVGNKIKTERNCARHGGEWNENPYSKYCVLPYSDAGKLCHNSKDCIGHCIWPLDEGLVDGKAPENAYGFCQMTDDPDDCGRPHFEDGKIIYFNCD